MYCDAPASPRRRATQMAMRQIFDALCRLLAPILVFTAEEAWGYLGGNGSVHLQLFPEPQGDLLDSFVREKMEELLKLRGVIGQAIEKARQEKLIGNASKQPSCLHCDERFATFHPARGTRRILHPERHENCSRPKNRAPSITKTPNKEGARAAVAAPADRGTIVAHPDCAIAAPPSWRPAHENLRPSYFAALRARPDHEISRLRFIDPYGPHHPILIPPDFFSLVPRHQQRCCFGSFRNNNGFFIALSCVALVVVTCCFCARNRAIPGVRVALGLLLAGVLAPTDRLLHGTRDRLPAFNLHIPYADPWPAFNVADSCICIAVVCFMIYSFRDSNGPRPGSA